MSKPPSSIACHRQPELRAELHDIKQRYVCHLLEGQEFHRTIPVTQPAVELWHQLSVQSCGCEARL